MFKLTTSLSSIAVHEGQITSPPIALPRLALKGYGSYGGHQLSSMEGPTNSQKWLNAGLNAISLIVLSVRR